ncbi:MAG: SPASM domain-containing protein, partial [Clostridiales bacterium]|nr:SPASM domain-containing protein [Clostridiales bacterium]
FLLGTVREGVSQAAVADMFKSENAYTKESCAACWAKFFCGGGCAANAWHYNRDIGKPNAFYCALVKKRIECALWLKCTAL